MDKRAAFEAWRAERYAQTTSWCNELGEYLDEFTQGQWKAWKGALGAQPAASAEPSDEEIDAIAASMPDGAGGMLKQWGYRQFARALLSRYSRPAGEAQPVAWLRSDELRKLGRPGSDAPLNARADSMILHAKGTPEAAARYGHDVPVYAAPVVMQNTEDTRDAERFEWLCDQQDVKWQTYGGEWIGASGSTLREIIDAAIAQQEVKQ